MARKPPRPLAFLLPLALLLAGCPGDDEGRSEPPPCQPSCDGRACGDDGCGGTCGACANPCSGAEDDPALCVEGACGTPCCPSCDGKACGDDGCGGSCGACANPCSGAADDASLCIEGACGTPCCPSCDGKACGDDGCGGSCGTCDAGTCFQGACCVPSCDGKACGDDGCGGSCGACGEGRECRDGACGLPCGRTGYEPHTAVSSWKPHGDTDRGTLFFQAVDAAEGAVNVLTLDIRQATPFDGPLGPGTYPFSTTKYSKCSICVRLSEGCSDQGCARQYLATEGVLEVGALDRADGPFQATLRDVTFREAIIDLDWASWIPPTGQTWCVDELPLEAPEVKLAVPRPTCVADSQDVLLDQNIGDFTLTNCLGEVVSLHSLCGKAKAVWFLLVAAWCPYCNEYAPQAARAQAAYGDAVRLLTVLGEDKGGNAPDLKECLAYAQSHGLDPAWTFADYGWQVTASRIYPYGFQGIPYEMVLDGDNMAFIWTTGQRGDLGTVLESLAAR